MKEETQVIETVLERDTDIILLEEFNTNNDFVEWFINLLELPKLTKNNGTWRSISDFGLGETDLLFSYNSNEKVIFVLIENKLDADFQEQQFERYQQRGEYYKTERKCSDYFTILVAPHKYVEGQNDFEKFVTYEEIKDFFELKDERRLNFKAKLFTIAIEKSKRGYQAINCEPVQNFWKSYWEFKEIQFPYFKMKKPNIVPFGSDWIEIRDPELKGIIFYHKLGKGYIDATFCNFPIETELSIKNNLPENYYFEKHKSGRFSIRQKISFIDRTQNFEKQKENVKLGLEKIYDVNKLIKQIINKNASS